MCDAKMYEGCTRLEFSEETDINDVRRTVFDLQRPDDNRSDLK